MFGFGPKRHRVSKSVGISRPETLQTRLRKIYEDRNLLGRLGVSVVAILLLVVALQAWKAPFSFRQGDYAEHGIAAKIEFERIDIDGTELARQRAEDTVPRVFRHDPQTLELLPEELRATLGEVAAAQSLDRLSEKTRKAFALTAPSSENEADNFFPEWYGSGTPEERFNTMRKAVVGPEMDMAEARIDSMIAEFGEFILPIQETGIVSPSDIRRHSITPDRRLLIVKENQELESGRTVLLPRVRLQDQLNEAGQMGYSWDIFDTLTPDIRPAIVHWLLERVSPTLRYDQATTTTEIALAREKVDPRLERYLKGDMLVDPQQFIDRDKLSLLEDEYEAAEEEIGSGARASRVAIALFMVAVLTLLN